MEATLDNRNATQAFSPKDYSIFEYSSYSLSEDGCVFTGDYALIGSGNTIHFAETITVPAIETSAPRETLQRLLFLACGLSYYKAAAPQVIHVKGGLRDSEREFLAKLIRHGLGEFCYRNDLPESLEPRIESDRLTSPYSDSDGDECWSLESRPLVPVGGGKDSIVTLESLKRIGARPIAFSVNKFKAIEDCIDISSCDRLRATRKLDRQLPSLNKAGAYNGHVPVTAINSIIALMVADSMSFGSIVMSNERSAEFGNLTWNGGEVNHQWSKSFAFEVLLREQLTISTLDPDRYFSLLRPLTELAIAERFAKLPKYFTAFTSCNRLFSIDPQARQSTWCCKCPKCHFVFLILAAFLPPEELHSIFGTNILDSPNNRESYREILGLTGHKPFECVGDYEEAAAAWRLAASQRGWRQAILIPQLLPSLQRIPQAAISQLLSVTPPHHIPKRFEEALHAIA